MKAATPKELAEGWYPSVKWEAISPDVQQLWKNTWAAGVELPAHKYPKKVYKCINNKELNVRNPLV